MFNSHLTAYPYGPFELRDGKTVPTVLSQADATQTSKIRDGLNALLCHRDHEPHLPTFLAGDHNIPSHLDITPG
jgi:hypothetical protein